jgi:hypothetical protein
MDEKVENMVARHVESVQAVIQGEGQKSDMAITVQALQIGKITNIPYRRIMNDTIDIIIGKRDGEGVRINQNPQDDDDQDMDNRPPEKSRRLDRAGRHLVSSLGII